MLERIFFFSFIFFHLTLSEFFQEINIRNSGLSVNTQIDIELNIDTASLIDSGNLQSLCQDIRFYHSDKLNMYKYFIESGCNTQNTIIWIRLDSLPNTTITKVIFKYGSPDISSGEESFSGQFIIPSEVSCPTEYGYSNYDSLENYFPRGTFSNVMINEVGGSEKHVHIISGTSSYSSDPGWSVFKSYEELISNLHPHQHAYNGDTFDSNSLPSYKEVNFCKGNKLRVYDGSLIMLSDSSDLSQRYGNYSAVDFYHPRHDYGGYFIREGKNNIFHNYNITHSHEYDIELNPSIAERVDSEDLFGTQDVSTHDHTHKIHGHTSYDLSIPPYIEVMFYSPNETLYNKHIGKGNIYMLPKSTIMATDIPPLGWNIDISWYKKFPRGTSSINNIGRQGGSEMHGHQYGPHETIKNTLMVLADAYNAFYYACHDHFHSIAADVVSYESHIPPYSDILFIKRKGNNNNIFIEYITFQNDWTNNIISTPFPIIETLIIFMIIVIIIISIALFIFVIFGFIYALQSLKLKKKDRKLRKFSSVKDIDIILNEQKVEEDRSIAKLKINKKLFEIDFKSIKIKDKLGQGGSNGVVYLCDWKGKEVAFKCFKTTLFSGDQNTFDEFEKEVAILASVSHPNIMAFFGAALKPPRVGYIMEYCRNGDLIQFLTRYKRDNNEVYSLKEKCRMILEVANACEYLHSLSIIHRDLKAANILVSNSFETKLMDFGASRRNEDVLKTKRVGTSHYMAPEITIGNIYTEKIDVFSFGILIYEIINDNFLPYGNSLTYNLEMKVANNPDFRPTIEVDAFGDVLWMVGIMKQCWNHEELVRPSFTKIVEEINNFVKLIPLKEIAKKKKKKRRIIEDELRLKNAVEKNEEKSKLIIDLKTKVKNLEKKLKKKEKELNNAKRKLKYARKPKRPPKHSRPPSIVEPQL